MLEARQSVSGRWGPDRLGSSHTSARCAMFIVFVILNVLLNSRSRQAGFASPAKSRSTRAQKTSRLRCSKGLLALSNPRSRRAAHSGNHWRTARRCSPFCLINYFTERSARRGAWRRVTACEVCDRLEIACECEPLRRCQMQAVLGAPIQEVGRTFRPFVLAQIHRFAFIEVAAEMTAEIGRTAGRTQ
ncbi:hypothetical protein ACVINW_004271 [Bradyrhizobium sp. USDA 4461]